MLTQDAASQRCIVVIVMSNLDPQGRRSSAAWQPGITLQELDMADVLRLWDSLLSESLSTKAIQGHPRPSKAIQGPMSRALNINFQYPSELCRADPE